MSGDLSIPEHWRMPMPRLEAPEEPQDPDAEAEAILARHRAREGLQ